MLGQFGGLGELEKFLTVTIGVYVAGRLVRDPKNRAMVGVAAILGTGLQLAMGAVVDICKVQFAVEEPAESPMDRYQGVAEPAPLWKKRTVVALKTNMLYDAATALNFAFEVPFNEKFSILYEHHCPWWLTGNNRYCLQLLSFGGEFRWWFKPKTRPESPRRVQRDALVGHFLGVYGMGGKFDLQANRTFCYQGEFFSAGLTYGYSMPIAKRVNLEFSISAGYARIPYRHYNPTDDWELLIRDRNKSGVWHYFGPTKIEVALSVPLLVKTKVKGGNR